VVQEDVALAQGGEDVFTVLERRAVDGGEGGELEVGALDVDEALDAQEVERAFEPEDVFAGEVEVVAEGVVNGVGDALFDFEADGGAAAEVAQLGLDGLEEVFGFFLVDVEVAVAGDAEGVGAGQPVAGEELAGAQLDDLGQENETLDLAGLVGIEAHEAREDARDGEDGDELLDVERGDDVERLVAELGKRVRLVEGERGEHGQHLLFEISLHPVELAGGELVGVFDDDALFGERGEELLVPAAVLVLDEGCDDGVDAAELLAGAEALGDGLGRSVFHLLDEAGDADLEKLVEVGAEDGEEADALEERVAVALGLLEDAAVEGEPAQLAVEIGGGLGALGFAGDGAGRVFRLQHAIVGRRLWGGRDGLWRGGAAARAGGGLGSGGLGFSAGHANAPNKGGGRGKGERQRAICDAVAQM